MVAIHEFIVPPWVASLRIERMTHSEARPQALRLRLESGGLEIQGQRLDDVVLWSDTSPSELIAAVRRDHDGVPMVIRVWNAWRDNMGAMQAWIGHSGMVVEQLSDRTTEFRCSDGFEALTFDDLVIRLTFEETATAPPSSASRPATSQVSYPGPTSSSTSRAAEPPRTSPMTPTAT